jgi:hypothetical protein
VIQTRQGKRKEMTENLKQVIKSQTKAMKRSLE